MGKVAIRSVCSQTLRYQLTRYSSASRGPIYPAPKLPASRVNLAVLKPGTKLGPGFQLALFFLCFPLMAVITKFTQ